MIPKTAMQKEVARLSATLRPITPAQREWAFINCIDHIAYRNKSGMMTCADCGHVWQSDNSPLGDTLEGCTCPHCGAKLKVEQSRRRTYKQSSYFNVISVCKGYEVIRVAQVRAESRKGEPMRYYCHEVVQRWISAEGKVTTMALLRGCAFYCCDLWALESSMEVRNYNPLYDNIISWGETYPKKRYIPQIVRNGFNGDFYGFSPVTFFKALLSDPRIETLMKAGETEIMKYFIRNSKDTEDIWSAYLIAKRHHYHINNFGMWADYLQMLKSLGQDIRNPKNICPEDFIEAHDKASRKIDAKREKERKERERRAEAQRREAEERRLLQEREREAEFEALKSKFFGLVISDNEISVKVLESIDEYFEEGKTQNICVFGSGYYKKADTLILSARIGGQIIETVEVDLRTLKVVQCHGKNNQNTTYHDRIINLVNANADQIRNRMTA